MAEKEYIEKSKLISDIECIDICDCTDIDDIFIEVERTIDEQPTADVQEVVRCKDCRWRGTEECSMYYRCNCGEQHTWETDNDFCSCGERKCGDGNG